MSNLFVALGCSDSSSCTADACTVRAGEAGLLERCALESTRLGSAVGDAACRARARATCATSTTLTASPTRRPDRDAPPTHQHHRRALDDEPPTPARRRRAPCPRAGPTTFGHGEHTCPAQPFSLAAMCRSAATPAHGLRPRAGPGFTHHHPTSAADRRRRLQREPRATSATGSAQPGHYRDDTHAAVRFPYRHQYRYWDGAQWAPARAPTTAWCRPTRRLRVPRAGHRRMPGTRRPPGSSLSHAHHVRATHLGVPVAGTGATGAGTPTARRCRRPCWDTTPPCRAPLRRVLHRRRHLPHRVRRAVLRHRRHSTPAPRCWALSREKCNACRRTTPHRWSVTTAPFKPAVDRTDTVYETEFGLFAGLSIVFTLLDFALVEGLTGGSPGKHMTGCPACFRHPRRIPIRFRALAGAPGRSRWPAHALHLRDRH